MMIKIKKLIGIYCSQRRNGPKPGMKGGESVRRLINDVWDAEDKIQISFEGVEVTTPSFMDEAFGKLVVDHSLEQLRDKLRFDNLNEEKKNMINKSIALRLKKKSSDK